MSIEFLDPEVTEPVYRKPEYNWGVTKPLYVQNSGPNYRVREPNHLWEVPPLYYQRHEPKYGYMEGKPFPNYLTLEPDQHLTKPMPYNPKSVPGQIWRHHETDYPYFDYDLDQIYPEHSELGHYWPNINLDYSNIKLNYPKFKFTHDYSEQERKPEPGPVPELSLGPEPQPVPELPKLNPVPKLSQVGPLEAHLMWESNRPGFLKPGHILNPHYQSWIDYPKRQPTNVFKDTLLYPENYPGNIERGTGADFENLAPTYLPTNPPVGAPVQPVRFYVLIFNNDIEINNHINDI